MEFRHWHTHMKIFCICMCTYTHIYTDICIHTCMYIYICKSTLFSYVCTWLQYCSCIFRLIARERERAETKKREACAIWKCSAKNDMLPTTTVCPSFACVACVTGRGRNRSNHWSSGSCSHGCASSMLQWDSTTLASTIGGVSVTVLGIETVRERQSIADIRPLIKQTYRFF